MTHCVWSHTTYCWEVVSSPVCASKTDLPPLAAAMEGNWLVVVLQRSVGVAVGVAGWGEEGVRAVSWFFLSALSGCVEEWLAL